MKARAPRIVLAKVYVQLSCKLHRYQSHAGLACRLAGCTSSTGDGMAMRKVSALDQTATGMSSWTVDCSYATACMGLMSPSSCMSANAEAHAAS